MVLRLIPEIFEFESEIGSRTTVIIYLHSLEQWNNVLKMTRIFGMFNPMSHDVSEPKTFDYGEYIKNVM